MYCLVVGFILTLSSCALAQQNIATVYTSSNYQGVSATYDVGYYRLEGSWVKNISSFKIKSGYELVGYYSEDFTRAYMIWDHDTPDLGFIWGDWMKSIEIRLQTFELTKHPNDRHAIAIIYNGTNDSAPYKPLGFSPGNVPSSFYVGAVDVTPGYQLTLYDSFNQSGNFKVFYGDSVPIKWDLTVKSYKVESKSNATLSDTVITSTSTNAGLIVGIVVGVIVVVGILGFLIAKRRKNKTQMEMATIEVEKLRQYRLETNTNNSVQLGEIIGRGSFAEVHKGKFNGETVAIKVLQSGHRSSSDIQNFINEITLTASFDSPYIVKMIGAVYSTPSDVKAVMEFMDLGDLRDYLVKNNSSVFTWDKKLDVLDSVVNGLCYLHSLQVIHRDLKSRNILLDSIKGAKLSDFGIAKEDTQGTMTRGIGTYRWMAPEVLMETAYTVAADIYSFGVILSELDSHDIPYHNLKNPSTGLPLAEPAVIAGVVNGTIRPVFSSTCPAWVKSLGEACLQNNPNDRPDIYEISQDLVKIKQKLALQ